MAFVTGLYARLVAQVSSAKAVYPLRLPEDPELPAVVYQQVGGPRDYSHDGEAFTNARWQITTWAETYLEAKALAEEVVAALSAWDDTSGTYVARSVTFITNEIDLYDADAELFYVPVEAQVSVKP
jgi:hypothetical protein